MMKRSLFKHICAVLTALCLLFTAAPLSGFPALPAPARAQAAEITASGECGETVTWTLDGDGLLTISGNGPMEDYGTSYVSTRYENQAPWKDHEVRSVLITDGVTGIGSGAFAGCDLLTAVTFSKTVSSVSDTAFCGCTSLCDIQAAPDNGSFQTENGVLFNRAKTTLICYPAAKPETTYTVPATVTSIANYAFGCGQFLTALILPDSVTQIGGDIIRFNRVITSVTFGNGLSSLPYGVFDQSPNLTEVALGAGIKGITSYTFMSCAKLRSITVHADNPYYSSSNGILFSKDLSKLLRYPAGKTETSYTIPNSVNQIEDYAFYGCTALTALNTAGSHSVFSSANGVLFNKSITTLLLYPCGKTAVSYTVPDSVTTINQNAFSGCKHLTAVTLGAGFTSFNASSLSGCSSLTSITLGKNVTTATYFNRIKSLREINVHSENPDFSSADGVLYNKDKTRLVQYPLGKPESAFVIPNGVKTIGGSAFESCAGLTDVTFSNSVNTVESYAFSGCTKLTDVSFGSGVTVIAGSAFYSCRGLRSLTLPYGLTSIGDSAFWGCTGLTSLTIPASVTVIGSRAFAECTQLETITVAADNTKYHSYGNCLIETDAKTLILGCKNSVIPSDGSVTAIGREAFYDCKEITDITIPNGVTSIEENAFVGCENLTSIVIPNSVTNIGSRAFGATGLTSVTLPSGITRISEYLFYGCRKLTGVTIPNSVTSIGREAFYGCTALTGITIPNSVESIGEQAFCNCKAITGVTIPNSVTYLGTGVFTGCRGLMRVTIENGIKSIGAGTFYSCTALTSVTIPSSVTGIGYRAFGNCTSLQHVCYTGSKDDWNAITVETDNDPLLNAKKYYNYAQEGEGVGYIVEYDANGGAGAPGYQAKGEGAVLTLSAQIPSKTYTLAFSANGGSVSPASKTLDCTFKNWNTQADGSGSSYPAGGSYAADEDATLYAQWIDPVAGSLPEPARGGYIFTGWYTAAEGGTPFTENDTVPQSMTLYAHWEKQKTYTVSYSANGGAGAPAAQTKTQGEPLTLRTAVPTKYYTIYYNANGGAVSTASKAVECTFLQWNTQANGSGNAYAPGGTYTNDESVTLFAQWDSPAAGALAVPTRADHTFTGWFTDPASGDEITADTVIISDVTVYAHWKKNPGKFTVSYNAGGGSGAPDSQVKTEDVPLTLSSQLPEKSYTLTFNANGGSVSPASKALSCAFREWNTQPAGGGVSYAPGGIYTQNASVTLYAQWTDPAAGYLPTPTKSGYTFGGWFTSPYGGEPVTADTQIRSAATVYAHWAREPEKYTVSYNANGGVGAPDPQTKEENTPLVLSDVIPVNDYTLTFNPTGGYVQPTAKTLNCTFRSWNTSPDGAGASYAPGGAYTANASAILYALWTAPAAGSLPVPARSGYLFTGWYTAASGGAQVNESTTVSRDTVLYAHWKEKQVYTITYNANGGTGAPAAQYKTEGDPIQLSNAEPEKTYTLTFNANGGSAAVQSKTLSCWLKSWNTSANGLGVSYYPGDRYTADASVTLYAQWTNPAAGELPTATRSGWKFAGWYTSPTGGTQIGSATQIGGDTVVYARWSDGQTYTVSYDANGGYGAPAAQTKHQDASLLLSTEFPVKAYTLSYNANGGSVAVTSKKVSCVFRNWNTAANGSGTSYESGGLYAKNADLTLYAQWTNPNAGTLPTPARTGYSFAGWYTAASGGTQYTAGTAVTGNTTLFARWTAVSYTATFKINGGKWANGSSEATRTLNYTPDQTLVAVFPQNNGVNWPFTRSSYVFSGWKVTSAGGNWTAGKVYADNWLAHETGMYGSVTFEAQWTYAPNTYTVAYNTNGGTGAPSTQSKIQDVTLMLSTLQPTKSFTVSYNAAGGSVSPASKSVSCTFRNWNTAQNGSGTVYSPGGNYTANANATLYAQWINPTAGALATPVRSGYLFAGWFTAASGGTRVTPETTLTGNITLYARWNVNTDIYNRGDETYSFPNYVDSDSYGHCFGMSMTSAGYYLGFLDIARIGGSASTPLYSFSDTAQVRRPICFYQPKQGATANKAIVAGGSTYKTRNPDIYSDWISVINYVKNHAYDNTGRLQIGFRKESEGGHAINFLRYENVNGQDRIYAYDNNFPTIETYFYKNASGEVLQAPQQTFSGAIDCIALRDVETYFKYAEDFNASHAVYVEKDAAIIQDYTFSYMDGTVSGTQHVLYEIPAETTAVKIIPNKDNADFIYLDTEYSFGTITEGTYGILEFATLDDHGGETDAKFTVYTESAEPETLKPGDPDNDGSVTTTDARLALRCAIGLGAYAADSPQFRACDITKDGKVGMDDARLILRRAIGLTDPKIW